MEYEKIVDILAQNEKTVSVMESCTGGGISNSITNIPGSSAVFNFAAVTYSNEYKIKMGVSAEVIDKYSVYSMQVADEMSVKISEFCGADYGIGVTGKLMCEDKNNLSGDDDLVYISIFDRQNHSFYNKKLRVTSKSRKENKKLVIEQVFQLLLNVI